MNKDAALSAYQLKKRFHFKLLKLFLFQLLSLLPGIIAYQYGKLESRWDIEFYSVLFIFVSQFVLSGYIFKIVDFGERIAELYPLAPQFKKYCQVFFLLIPIISVPLVLFLACREEKKYEVPYFFQKPLRVVVMSVGVFFLPTFFILSSVIFRNPNIILVNKIISGPTSYYTSRGLVDVLPLTPPYSKALNKREALTGLNIKTVRMLTLNEREKSLRRAIASGKITSEKEVLVLFDYLEAKIFLLNKLHNHNTTTYYNIMSYLPVVSWEMSIAIMLDQFGSSKLKLDMHDEISEQFRIVSEKIEALDKDKKLAYQTKWQNLNHDFKISQVAKAVEENKDRWIIQKTRSLALKAFF